MSGKKIKIGDKVVGEGEPTFIIAEAGSNHDGKLEQAKRLIDIASDAGVDAIKFQAFKADKIFNEVKNKDIVDKLEKLELREEWYKKLFDYANEKGLIFISSVFDEDSADLLDNLGIAAYKIASYELTHIPLLEYIAKKNKPLILSTGMANESEVKEAVECIYSAGNRQVIILHCVSQYPAEPENINLKSLLTLKRIFDCPIGFSDHTETIYAPIAAVTLGAKAIEKHFTLDKSLPGPDHAYALEPEELKQMVTAIREVEKMSGSEEIKPTKSEINERKWRRAIYAACDISDGTVIAKEMLMIVRPSPDGSLAPKYLKELLGKRIKKNIEKGDFITEEMVDLL
jgi:N-acetylneuraminate synthase/N,N'-diacetyllegionaminate synthase